MRRVAAPNQRAPVGSEVVMVLTLLAFAGLGRIVVAPAAASLARLPRGVSSLARRVTIQ
jgi:hypothetical protein